MIGGRAANTIVKTHHTSPYFPFLSSGLSLSPEKQKRHDMVVQSLSAVVRVCELFEVRAVERGKRVFGRIGLHPGVLRR